MIKINWLRKNNIFNPLEICMLVVIFLCGMNFFAKFFYFCYIAFFLCLLSSKKVKFSRSYIVVGLFCIIFGLYGVSSGLIEMFRRLGFFCMYYVGYNITAGSDNGTDENSEKKLIAYVVAFSMGALLHYLLNFSLNFNLEVRNGLDIWTRAKMAATGQAALAVPALGVAAGLMVAPKNEFKRLIGIAILVAIMAYDLVLAVRYLPMIFMIVLVAAVVSYLFTEKDKKRKRRMIFISGSAVLILLFLYIFNIFGIRTIVQVSNLYNRVSDYS